jgi:hypothetical protein
LIILQALAVGLRRDPDLAASLKRWAARGIEYQLQRLLALAYGNTNARRARE